MGWRCVQHLDLNWDTKRFVTNQRMRKNRNNPVVIADSVWNTCVSFIVLFVFVEGALLYPMCMRTALSIIIETYNANMVTIVGGITFSFQTFFITRIDPMYTPTAIHVAIVCIRAIAP